MDGAGAGGVVRALDAGGAELDALELIAEVELVGIGLAGDAEADSDAETLGEPIPGIEADELADLVALAGCVSISGIDDPASATGCFASLVAVPVVAAVPITATITAQPATAAAAATVEIMRPTRMKPV